MFLESMITQCRKSCFFSKHFPADPTCDMLTLPVVSNATKERCHCLTPSWTMRTRHACRI